MNLKNKIIFITGTNRGIGKALVQEALNLGAKKIYASVRDLSLSHDFSDPRVLPIKLDITNKAQIFEAVNIASDTQVLINNAGTLQPGNILEGDIDDLQFDMNVNYISTIRMMRAFAKVLEQNHPASIVNIVSIAAYTSFPFIAGYSASKAALYSATQSVRIELVKKDITVHSVNPGAIETDMTKGNDMDMTSPEDVARSILKEVEAGTLDIIPDKIGRMMYDTWRKDPAELEQKALEMYYNN